MPTGTYNYISTPSNVSTLLINCILIVDLPYSYAMYFMFISESFMTYGFMTYCL